MSTLSEQPLRLAFIITSLNSGGAEQMLIKVVLRLAKKNQCHVFTLKGQGVLRERLIQHNIPFTEFQFGNPLAWPFEFIRLCRCLGRLKPDLVQTWLYHADFFGGFAARIMGLPVLWNVRSDQLGSAWSALPNKFLVRILSGLSRFIPQKIIFCSKRAMKNHQAIGYEKSRCVWLPNGFDLSQFFPQSGPQLLMRNELKISADDFVIGTIGRLDPLKDYGTFFAAAQNAMQKGFNGHFILVGKGLTPENIALNHWLKPFTPQQRQHIHLLGYRENVVQLLQNFDLFTLTSTAEAFPNVLGEAMACEIPCVSTNVGDAAEIVDNTGRIVDVGDVAAITEAWLDLSQNPKQCEKLGQAARRRVQEFFDIEKVVDLYLSNYKKVLKDYYVRN